jgi:hypothetical protein
MLKSFSIKTHQSNKCYGGIRDEEERIGGIIDLGLLFQTPQQDARIIWGRKKKALE